MKLTINGVSVSFDKIPKEIVVNGSEYTIINDDSSDEDSSDEDSSDEDSFNEKDIDYTEMTDCYCEFENPETCTGVVKNREVCYYINGKCPREETPTIKNQNRVKSGFIDRVLNFLMVIKHVVG